MKGSLTVPFSELFKDTITNHGVVWAWNYYVRQHKMAQWEFNFWRMACRGTSN